MTLRRYIFHGASVGLVLPALLIAFAVATGSFFESPVVAVAIVGFLPFGSSDPEQEMSWACTALAFLLNAGAFGLLGLLVGLLHRRAAQSVGQADTWRTPDDAAYLHC